MENRDTLTMLNAVEHAMLNVMVIREFKSITTKTINILGLLYILTLH